jgi:AraC-like DNA-binding protein
MRLESYCYQISNETGAVVNINTSRHPAFTEMEDMKLSPDYEVHHGKFCVWARRNGGFSICRKNKLRSIQVAAKGKSFCGRCPWGIWDLAIPVRQPENKFPVIVYLGYFLLPETAPELLNHKIYSGPLPPVLTPEKKAILRHYGFFLADLIRLNLLEYASQKKFSNKHKTEDYYCHYCEKFIEDRYSEKISLAMLADELKVNPNYIGSLLFNKNGKTFRELLTEKRLNVAYIHLKMNFKFNVSQIAELSGFGDSNYFCKVFSDKFGISPLKFRQRANAPDITPAIKK